MIRLLLNISVIAALTFFANSASAVKNDSLQRILDDHWSAANKEQIFFRKDPDTFRMNGHLPDMSASGRARREAFNKSVVTRLYTLDADELSDADKVSYRLFQYERQAEAASYGQLEHLYPMHKYSSFWSYFAGAPANMSFLESADYEKYLLSLADYPRYSAQFQVGPAIRN